MEEEFLHYDDEQEVEEGEIVDDFLGMVKFPWAGARSRCSEDGFAAGARNLRMMQFIRQSIGPSTQEEL
ncbi:hypothetical protein NDU88_001722 [Pleurodeles waltl]|uniref:Uncharacterized protein n=1 Tax=Pleurodeles waltl TaxID=8319 RepID=A0AAV7LMC1_PLEWA|nr:hypothetical protein NDU88_001722 [Pleurodeles waltl]